MNLFTLMAKIGLDDSEFKSGVSRAENSFGGFGKKVAGIIAGLGIAKLGKDIITMGIKTDASLESSGVAWTTLLGTQEKSKKMLNDITTFAAKTPFTKMGVDTMAKQLNNAGFTGQKLFDQLTKFGDMGSAFGVQEDSLKEMVRQYAQVQQAGVAYTEDLNILQDRGIPIYKALADATGLSVAEVKKMAGEGKISADIYNTAIDSISSKTKGAMGNQSKTFSGLWSTIKDGAENIIGKIMIPIFEKLKSVMEDVGPTIDKIGAAFETFNNKTKNGESFSKAFSESFKGIIPDIAIQGIIKIRDLFVWIIDNKDSIIAALVGIGTAMTVFTVLSKIENAIQLYKAWRLATEGMTLAQALFNIVMASNPIILIISAIAGLVAALVVLWNTNEGFRNAVIEIFTAIGTFFQNLFNTIITFFTSTIPNAFLQFVGFLGQLPAQILTFISQIMLFFAQLGVDLINWVITAIPQFISNFINFLSTLPSKIGYVIGMVIGSIVKFGADLINWAVVAIPNFVGTIVNFIAQLPGNIWNFLVSIIQQFGSWVGSLINWAVTAIPNFVGSIVRFIAQLPGKIWNFLTQVVSNVFSWGGNLASSGVKAATELVTSIVNKISELPGKMLEIGGNIVKGIWNGISGGVSWLWGKVTDFAGGIVDGFKSALGIHSPSRVMANLVGKYIPRGITVGIDKEMPNTIKGLKTQVNDMVASVVPTFKDVNSNGNNTKNIKQDLQVNIYNPTPSPSEIIRKFKNEQQRLGLQY